MVLRAWAGDCRGHPELFDRLGVHGHEVFRIDPVNLPFALEPRVVRERPQLRALRRSEIGAYDVGISGTLLTLLGIADGTLDGDALFFSRELELSGDTEAAVSLRNAMDDTDGTLAYRCLNLLPDLAALRKDGVSAFRLSPHGHGMATVARIFRDALDERIDVAAGLARPQARAPELPFCNGFYHGAAGHARV